MSDAPTPVDTWLAARPDDVRAALEHLREVIRAAAPAAIESISYQVPTFSDRGFLVSFGASKDRCSFYVRSLAVMEAHRTELAPYSTSGGTVHFTADAPLPDDLVRTLVQARMAENQGRRARSKG
jgi:uncharacterized protein YdhG (YjbR/CyaY superfamily)